MPRKTAFVHLTAFDEPNIGVMEVSPENGVDENLLKTILEEHFDVECEVKAIRKVGDEFTGDYEADVVIDPNDEDCRFKLKLKMKETWVYHSDYNITKKLK